MEKLKVREQKCRENAQNVGAIVSVGDGPIACTASNSGTGAGNAEQPTKSETAAAYITAIDADLKQIADNLAEIWGNLEELQGVLS